MVRKFLIKMLFGTEVADYYYLLKSYKQILELNDKILKDNRQIIELNKEILNTIGEKNV